MNSKCQRILLYREDSRLFFNSLIMFEVYKQIIFIILSLKQDHVAKSNNGGRKKKGGGGKGLATKKEEF